MINTTLGHYRILEKLGQGRMGVVYRARDLRLGRDVAIKMLPGDLLHDEGALGRLRSEARNLSRVNHPHVETVYELGEDGASEFLVTELIAGQTLARRIDAGRVSEPELVTYGSQIALALEAVHAHGVVHRDLKPANIMITEGERVKVVDFGLARLLPRESATTETSGKNVISGTLLYMAPEVLRGVEARPASDLYSLGAVLYEMATGRPPHDADSVATLVFRILEEPVAPPRAIRPQLSPGVEAVILRCLEKDPAARYASAAEVAEALALAASAAPGPPTRQGAPRRRVLSASVALVLVAVLAILALPDLGRLFRSRPRLVAARVVVAPFENATGRRELDPVGRMTADWISQGLTRTGLIEVVQPATALQVADGTAAAASRPRAPGEAHLGEETGAATVVSGTYYLQGDSLVFQTRLTETASGRLIAALDPVGTRVATPLVAIETLRRRVMAGLAARLDPALSRFSDQIGRPPSYESYVEYVAGLDDFVHRRWEEALGHYRRAADEDTSYYFARLSVGVAYLNLNRAAPVDSVVRSLRPVASQLSGLESEMLEWLTAWRHGDAEEAYRVARNMAALAPASLWCYQHGLSAVLTNRPREAVATLQELDPGRGVYRGWSPYWETLTAAEHMLGRSRQELGDARRGGRQYRDLLSILSAEVRAEAALGDERAVERLVDRSRALPEEPGWSSGTVMLLASRELRAHGRREAARRMAERAVAWYGARIGPAQGNEADSSGLAAALYQAERWRESRTVYQALAAARPDYVHYLGYLGALAARTGLREAALDYLTRLERAGAAEPTGAAACRSADVAALLGDHERALALLRLARDQGHAIYYKMHSDPDLESLRSDPRFQALLRPKG